MPVLVEESASTAELFAPAIGGRADIVANLEQLKQWLTLNPEEYGVVLGPSVDLEAAAALAETLRVTRPATSVILIRSRVDTSILAEALRSGMREVVEERDTEGLSAAVSRAAEVWQAVVGPTRSSGDAASGRVVTVFSPKGGVGKTTLAVNLALTLAGEPSKRVCVVDLDLAFGDVAITLQLFPNHTIADTAGMAETLDAALLETVLIPYRENLSALVAPVQPDAKESIPPALIGRTLRVLREEFDYVVVDTAPAFDEYVLQAFDETDEVFLVTTLDVPTLKNVKIAIETLDLLNFPSERRHLILNRADDKVGLSSSKVESALGMSITTTIPTSPQVANSTNSGRPIVDSLPRHPVSLAVKSLTEQLTSPSAGAALEAAHPAPTRRSLLRRNR